jgi:hypothetical protein
VHLLAMTSLIFTQNEVLLCFMRNTKEEVHNGTTCDEEEEEEGQLGPASPTLTF